MIQYCERCEASHEPPVAESRGDYCRRPEEKFCGCGHRLEDCAPQRCRHAYAQDALWGNS